MTSAPIGKSLTSVPRPRTRPAKSQPSPFGYASAGRRKILVRLQHGASAYVLRGPLYEWVVSSREVLELDINWIQGCRDDLDEDLVRLQVGGLFASGIPRCQCIDMPAASASHSPLEESVGAARASLETAAARATRLGRKERVRETSWLEGFGCSCHR
jgi:hypothetical protein